MKLTIDGQIVHFEPGEFILDVASRTGISIPALCYGSENPCKVCAVEIEGREGLVPACSTPAEDGMVVATQSDSVRAHRKHILELKLSRHYGDCISPCSFSCPANINIQGYVSLIGRGQYLEALRLIKEKNPLPLSTGRICPHPCQDMCRRMLVDEPVTINHLKRFVADYALHAEQRDILGPLASTGHRVAVIGGGPSGLSAAYYLARKGHAVTILEAMPKLGGMLRYGIPEYRLPKKILDLEIRNILQTAIGVRTGQGLGKDFTLETLSEEGFGAIFVGIGAWREIKMGVEGEDLEGVVSGLEFLRNVAAGNAVNIGKKVAVIGGGNSAIDVARTCLRIGAEEVTIIYRRSRLELPAREQEVRKAEAEGVRFFFVATPSRIMRKDGHLKIEVLRTRLSEPEKDGRRRYPVPISGSEVIFEVDNVFSVIGQRPDVSLFSTEGKIGELAISQKDRIIVDPDTFQTSVKGVFAGGDVVSGPRTVVKAVGAGRRAADSIHLYLTGTEIRPAQTELNVTRGGNLDEVDLSNFAGIQIEPSEQIPERPPNIRIRSFIEYTLGFSEDMALREAGRCLGCGCVALPKCELRRLAMEYGADLSVLGTEKRLKYAIDDSHPLITIDPNKCIFCQRCRSNCEFQAMEVDASQFDENDIPLDITIRINESCTSCGKCVDSCPTGALVKKCVTLPVPSDRLKQTRTVCAYCGCGCNLTLNVNGESLVDVTSDPSHAPNFGNTCVKGRFGYDFLHHKDRLTHPLVRKGDYFVEETWEEALSLVSRNFLELKERYGPQVLACLSSAKCTNEENYLIQKFMRAVIGTNNVDHCARL
jgi:formate dehydrogenase major subunit